LSLGKGQVR